MVGIFHAVRADIGQVNDNAVHSLLLCMYICMHKKSRETGGARSANAESPRTCYYYYGWWVHRADDLTWRRGCASGRPSKVSDGSRSSLQRSFVVEHALPKLSPEAGAASFQHTAAKRLMVTDAQTGPVHPCEVICWRHHLGGDFRRHRQSALRYGHASAVWR